MIKELPKDCFVYFPFLCSLQIFVSKIVDFDDYSVHDDIFVTLITLVGGDIFLGITVFIRL